MSTPVECPQCGASMDPRGLPGHIRAVHDRGLGQAWPTPSARTFPALTLWQPWASLIFTGDKLHETRGFALPAKYVGQWVAIHAAARKPRPHEIRPGLRRLCNERFGEDWADHLPWGSVLGLVRFAAALKTDRLAPGEADGFCGDFSPGRFAWPIISRRALELPEVATGRQGWWRVTIDHPPQLGE